MIGLPLNRLAACLFLLPLPAYAQSILSDPKAAAAAGAYMDCNHDRRERYLTQYGDPVALGTAAEAACSAKRRLLALEITRIMQAGQAAEMIADWKERMIESNIGWIAEKRSR